jgi:hypothetical protein
VSLDWPRYVLYKERLSPDAEPVEVELPQSRHDAFDLLATLNRLATEDSVAWKAAVRQYTACDWYVLSLFLSGTQRLDPFTGRPEVDCDFQFNVAREHQFDGDRVLDKSARGHWKSTWRCYVGVTNLVINEPNEVVAIIAHLKEAAQRHGLRTMNEWANNVELKAAWDDVFYQDVREAPLWNQETGCTVKRTLPATLPTLSWHAIMTAPTGSRVGVFIADDIESEGTVESEDMRKKTLQRFTSFLETGGRVPRIWVNGTHHHSNGLLTHLEKSGAFRTRCHAIEDRTRLAPDIAALYDECGGVMPVRDEGRRQKLPPAVREIRLAGAPPYLHPLEVALKRLDAMSTPGGLANYSMQNMGDALAGQERSLDRDWIRWYTPHPQDWAKGANLYICIDPSKGAGDPTFARVEACKADKTISWVGGLRRKLSPSEFAPAIFNLSMAWIGVGNLIEIRVEEFGQSTWTHMLRTYFDSVNQHVGRLVACSRHSRSNKESEGRQREWSGLEPLYRMGRRLYPEDGLWEVDENGQRYNMVDYYLDKEYGMFPLPITDDGLAADYLLAVNKGRSEDGRDLDLVLDFPTSEEEEEIAWRSSHKAMRFSGMGTYTDDQSTSWMSDFF